MARTKLSQLDGKIVAITGGARGIGRATAAEFLTYGAKVAIGDIDDELAENAAAELGAEPGAEVVGRRLDVTDRASFAAFLDAVAEEFGGLDVLVNNAGIMPTGLYIDEDDAMTERMLDVNVRGVLIGSKLAAERFVPAGSGYIVNIASIAGVVGEAGLATYCGTKHFVVGFTEALHLELRESGVIATAVLPGIVRTELSAGTHVPRVLEGLTTVDPEDVATTVAAVAVRKKARVTVPRTFGGSLKVLRLLPERAQRGFAHVTKLDRAFTEADPELRAAYHRRLNGEQG